MPAVKELEQNDAESAALIKAMLMQDQMNNPYYDDAYDNDFVKEAPAAKRGDKKASDDEDGKPLRWSQCKVLTSIQMILYQRKLKEKFERRLAKVCCYCGIQSFVIFKLCL